MVPVSAGAEVDRIERDQSSIERKSENLQEITSHQNPKFRAALQLHTSRGRRKQNRIVIFGWRETERALANAIAIQHIFICRRLVQPTLFSQIVQCANEHQADVYQVPETLFEKLKYGKRTDGVVATAIKPEIGLAEFSVTSSSVYLVVQGVEKPGNLGAIVRSADGAGVHGVIVVDALTEPFHPNAIRSSMGTVFSVPVAVTSSEIAQQWLRQNEIKMVIARPDATFDFYDADLQGKLALVLGNEARGLTDDWNVPDAIAVRLPMNGIADSLNVSVSASIMAYEAFRQRRSK